MKEAVLQRLQGLRRRPLRTCLWLALAAALGWGGYLAARLAWGEHQYRLAVQAYERRAFDHAQDRVRRTLAISPDSAKAHFLAGRTARHLELYPLAEEHFTAYQRLQGSGEALTRERALLRAQQGDLPANLELYLRRAVENSDPETVEILEALARGYVRLYRMNSAQVCLDQWLERRPREAAALVLRGRNFQRAERYDEAVQDFRDAVAAAPEHVEARLTLAHLLLRVKQMPESAREHFQHLYDRPLRSSEVLAGLAVCHRELGRLPEAQAVVEEGLAADPDDGWLLIERGRLAILQGDFSGAEIWLKRAVEVFPTEPQGFYLLSQCQEQLGKPVEAAQARARHKEIMADRDRVFELSRKVQESPFDPVRLGDLGLLLLRLGKEEEALPLLNRALEVKPDYGPAHAALADYYRHQGNEKLAAYHRGLADDSRTKP